MNGSETFKGYQQIMGARWSKLDVRMGTALKDAGYKRISGGGKHGSVRYVLPEDIVPRPTYCQNNCLSVEYESEEEDKLDDDQLDEELVRITARSRRQKHTCCRCKMNAATFVDTHQMKGQDDEDAVNGNEARVYTNIESYMYCDDCSGLQDDLISLEEFRSEERRRKRRQIYAEEKAEYELLKQKQRNGTIKLTNDEMMKIKKVEDAQLKHATYEAAKYGWKTDNAHLSTQQQANRKEKYAKDAASRKERCAKEAALRVDEKNKAQRIAAERALKTYNSKNVNRDLTSSYMTNSDLKALMAHIRLFEELPRFQGNRKELLKSLAERTRSDLNEYFHN